MFSASSLLSCDKTACLQALFLEDSICLLSYLLGIEKATSGGAAAAVDKLTSSSWSGLKGFIQLVSINWTRDMTSASILLILRNCRSG